jgi:hypothetical protein
MILLVTCHISICSATFQARPLGGRSYPGAVYGMGKTKNRIILQETSPGKISVISTALSNGKIWRVAQRAGERRVKNSQMFCCISLKEGYPPLPCQDCYCCLLLCRTMLAIVEGYHFEFFVRVDLFSAFIVNAISL